MADGELTKGEDDVRDRGEGGVGSRFLRAVNIMHAIAVYHVALRHVRASKMFLN